MPKAGSDLKSPSLRPPRPKSTDSNPPRQVHFDDKSRKSPPPPPPTPPPPENINNNTQPDSHPQVGCSLPYLNRPPSGQWYTAADPTRSVNCQPAFTHTVTTPGAVPPQHHFQYPLVNNQQQQQHFGHPGVSYIGHHQNNMGDYQNCAPPPTGVNFQPPVPDTTFGPIPHVYVPRFDGHFQVGVSFPFVPTAAAAVCVAPQTTTTTTASPVFAAYYQPAVGPVPVPVQNAYGIPQPSYIPMAASQPVMLNGQAYIPAGHGFSNQQQPMMAAAAVPGHSMPMGMPAGAPIPVIPGNATSSSVPDVSGLGKTPHEETLRQVEFAYNNRLFEPQDFKPADDDPSRFYYVREVDGNWTQRNRFTIDHMGDCRWYVTDEGWFYAVRLPD